MIDWQITLEYLYPDAPAESWMIQGDGDRVWITDWKLAIALTPLIFKERHP